MARLKQYYNETVVKEMTEKVWLHLSNAGAKNHKNHTKHGCW